MIGPLPYETRKSKILNRQSSIRRCGRASDRFPLLPWPLFRGPDRPSHVPPTAGDCVSSIGNQKSSIDNRQSGGAAERVTGSLFCLGRFSAGPSLLRTDRQRPVIVTLQSEIKNPQSTIDNRQSGGAAERVTGSLFCLGRSFAGSTVQAD